MGKRLNKSIDKTELKIVFIGTSSAYSLACLNAIKEDGFRVVGVLDSIRPKERYTRWDKWMMKNSKLAEYCGKDIDICVTDDLNGIKTERFIRERDCNLICVASACQLLKENIINIPAYGVMNAHGAVLPDYRGANPPYWVFRNFERRGGVTIHFVDTGEDTGDIITVERFNIPHGMSKKQYDAAVVKSAVQGYKKALRMLVSGTAERSPQGESPHPQARNVTREDFLLDYGSWEVERAYHFLRGTDGIGQIYSGGLCSYEVLDFLKSDSVAAGKYDICCKDGVIRVRQRFRIVRAIKNIMKGVLTAR